MAAGDFDRKAHDAIFIGPPGVGKSHLVQSLGPRRIGKRLQWMRACVFAEDASAARSGSIPENTAMLRNAAISVIRLDKKNI